MKHAIQKECCLLQCVFVYSQGIDVLRDQLSTF